MKNFRLPMTGRRNKRPREYRKIRGRYIVIFSMFFIASTHVSPASALSLDSFNDSSKFTMQDVDDSDFYPLSPIIQNAELLSGKIWINNGISQSLMDDINEEIKENGSSAILLLSDEEIRIEHLDEPVEFDPMDYISLVWSDTDVIPSIRIDTNINKEEDGEYKAKYYLETNDKVIAEGEFRIKVETPEWKIKEREELRRIEERKREKEERIEKFISFAISQVGKGGDAPLAYFGNDEAWCSEFVSYCAHMVGLVEEVNIFPKYSYCAQGISFFKNNGRFHTKSSGYIPQRGDVVFFGSNGESHTGIVKNYSNGVIYTIEGNSTSGDYHYSKTAEHKHNLSDGYVYGFGNPDF